MKRRFFVTLTLVALLAAGCTSTQIDGSASAPDLADDSGLEQLSQGTLITAQAFAEQDDADNQPADDQTSCEAPALQSHFVDVATGDPDGGLNLRDGAGVVHEVVATIERGNELLPTGECTPIGATDWWQVTSSDGSQIGWVSSQFLSDQPVFSPGLGAPEADLENVGLTSETFLGLAEQLAIQYGFDEDVVITQVGETQGHDASTGTITFDLMGLKDDAIDGYRTEILFTIELDPIDALEVVGFSTTRVDRRALCSRGVADDGLCI